MLRAASAAVLLLMLGVAAPTFAQSPFDGLAMDALDAHETPDEALERMKRKPRETRPGHPASLRTGVVDERPASFRAPTASPETAEIADTRAGEDDRDGRGRGPDKDRGRDRDRDKDDDRKGGNKGDD